MKSTPLRVAAPLAAVLLTTCSWTTNFVVMNSGREAIRVAYLARPLRTRPMVTVTSNLSEGPRSWRELNVRAARPDSAQLTLVLGPDSSLVLAQMVTYVGYQDELADWFEIKALKILSTFGERSYRGREVLRAFEKRSDRLYVVEVR